MNSRNGSPSDFTLASEDCSASYPTADPLLQNFPLRSPDAIALSIPVPCAQWSRSRNKRQENRGLQKSQKNRGDGNTGEMLQSPTAALRQEGTTDLNRTLKKRMKPSLVDVAVSHTHLVREGQVFLSDSLSPKIFLPAKSISLEHDRQTPSPRWIDFDATK